MPRLRKALLRLVALLFGVTLALVFAEVGLRVSRWPGPPLRSGRLEPQHRSAPSKPDFRDRPNPLLEAKPPGVRRFVVVGDSFTWGAGVLPQDAYPDRMQTVLDRAAAPAAPAVQIVNFSRPGWNTMQELGALRRSIDRLEPDAIVLGYCLNDVEPSRRRELAQLRTGVFPREPTTRFERFLFPRSALYRIVFTRADNLRMRRATTAYYHRFYVDAQPTWVATRQALGEMKALAASRQIPFLVVVFPIFDSQLDHRYHYHELHETMASAASELGIDLADLLPRYVGIDGRRLALDPFLDAHPSELAHRIAASAILEELESRGWLSVPSPAASATEPAPSEDEEEE